jgi:peptidoglycan/LPS O-acetylase OafA/YrhL
VADSIALEDRIKSRVESVEFLRGVAAFSVAWFHFTNGGGLLPDGWLKASGSYGGLGVQVFFVISGFIIPYSMYTAGFRFPADVLTFIWKRILRLEPPYLVAVFLAVALWYLSAIMPGFRGSEPNLDLSQLLLHVGYMNGIFERPWLNPVFWSLAIEFQFYLFTALVFPIFFNESAVVRFAGLTLFCAIGFVFPDPRFLFHFAGLFALGIITFWRFAGLIRAGTFALLVLAAAAMTMEMFGIPIAVAGFATALAIAFVKIPRVAAFTFLGAISYSLYLLHVPIGGRVVNFGTRFADSVPMQILVLLAAVACSLFAAYLMFRWIERPAQSWSSALRYRAKVPQTGASTPKPTVVDEVVGQSAHAGRN